MLGLGLSIPGVAIWEIVGAGAAAGMHPAPPGFHWVFVFDNGVPITDGGVPVVDLIGN